MNPPHHLPGLPSRIGERIRPLDADRPLNADGRFVLYWLRTAQRAHDNPALDAALWMGDALGLPVFVYQALAEREPWASDRHHRFALEGAREVAAELRAMGVGTAFHLEREGHRGGHLLEVARGAALIVTEDLPVRWTERWDEALSRAGSAPVWRVDTACIWPARLVPPGITDRAFRFRQGTHRDRMHRVREGWPCPPPVRIRDFVPSLPFEPLEWEEADLDELVAQCVIDHAIAPVPHTQGGSSSGYARWEAFLAKGLRSYHLTRNDPLRDGVSRMSAYLHYGMVSPFRIARMALEAGGEGAEKYLDELLTWRELAYAFCLHHPEHDTVAALPAWARATLADGEASPRPPAPPRERIERGRTGDALWDAAQRSLRIHGELHNNVRMTWGKAIPGWTPDASTALELLLDLNHRYALDGRDPASYGGILWCLGQFDRPFTPPVPILGTVRPRPTAEHARRLDVSRWTKRVGRPAHRRPPRVAIVGGGVSGLACARTLVDHGLEPVVFDKGRRPGGRLATREPREGGGSWDHGAQFFTARDRPFRRAVEGWREAGVVAPWTGRLVRIADGTIEDAREAERFVARPGMRSLADWLAEEVDVRSGVRIARSRPGPAGGHLLTAESGEEFGPFDVLVIAVPAPQAVPLLADASELAGIASRVSMAPCWTLLLEAAVGGGPEWDAAFLVDPVLDWVARNGSKPGREGARHWVVQASGEWSAAHLEDPELEVAAALSGAFERVTGCSLDPARPPSVHRWRYALPPDPLPDSCLWDRELGIGACGDWCGGPRVEGAWKSGIAMAGRILAPESNPARGASAPDHPPGA